MPAPDVAGAGPADRNRHVEPSQDAAAPLDRIEIGDNRRHRGPVGRFADADEDAREQQREVELREAGRAGGQAPDEDADGDDFPARRAIGEPTEERRGEHVRQEKRRGEQPHFGVADRLTSAHKLFADLHLDRRQHLAIDVVHQIDREQQHHGDAQERTSHGTGGAMLETDEGIDKAQSR